MIDDSQRERPFCDRMWLKKIRKMQKVVSQKKKKIYSSIYTCKQKFAEENFSYSPPPTLQENNRLSLSNRQKQGRAVGVRNITSLIPRTSLLPIPWSKEMIDPGNKIEILEFEFEMHLSGN